MQNLKELPKVVHSSKELAKFLVLVNSIVAQAKSTTAHSSSPSLVFMPKQQDQQRYACLKAHPTKRTEMRH